MQQAAGCWRELRKIKGGKLDWDYKTNLTKCCFETTITNIVH